MNADTKELVIEAHIPLSEDYAEEVKTAAKVTEAYDAFRNDLTKALGDGAFKLYMTRALPTPPKKPRAPRSDTGQPRAPRARRNGTAEQPGA